MFLDWLRPKPAAASSGAGKAASSFFGVGQHGLPGDKSTPGEHALATLTELVDMAPKVATSGMAQDDSIGEMTLKMSVQPTALSEILGQWYASQGFIGHQFCAVLAQHWLIDKACSMPGRDAIRNGFDIVSIDGDELDPEAVKMLKRYDRSMRLAWNLEQFIRMGRIFGVRVAFFRVDSTDPEYYEKPFNIDGVTPGSYKGIVQVDPYWTAPELDGNAASRPDTMHFYEPTYWRINGRRYHRSHLIIYRHRDPPDLLKPKYLYGGIPVPQLIMERVYAAERIANEAPELAMSKRTNVWLTDMSQFAAKGDESIARLNFWVQARNNYGVKLGDKDDDQFQQFDTTLSDLDNVIMTEYQIVAAAANVPATKLLGTTPKGFNSTGEYEEASYHEELESIQAHDLSPLIERHHALLMRSEVLPKLGGDPVETIVSWRTLDTPTAKELADTNLVKAQTGAALIASGAISSEEERRRVGSDPDGGYNDLGLDEDPAPDDDDDPDGNNPGGGQGGPGTAPAEPNNSRVSEPVKNQGAPESGSPAPKPQGQGSDAGQFNESDHPRADNGQFGNSGGAGSATPNENPESQLGGLAQLARSKGNENKTVVYGQVSDKAATLAKEKAGVDISGYQHAADMYAVRHALKHGDAAAESMHGQLAVTDKDIASIPDVVSSPELVVYAGKTHIGRDAIASVKTLDDGTVLVVEEIRTGRKTLALTSMRKYPATRNAESVARSLAAEAEPNKMATDSVPLYVRNDSGVQGAIVVDCRSNCNNEQGDNAQDAAPLAAGILYLAGGRVLLLKRADDAADYPGAWAFPAGHIEAGETPEQAALRESREETGFAPESAKLLRQDGGFTLFLARIGKPFAAALNDESSGYLWARPDELPQPLHPGVREAVELVRERLR